MGGETLQSMLSDAAATPSSVDLPTPSGEGGSGVVRLQQEWIAAALQDPSPEVRANACMLVGNTGVSVPIEELEQLRENDLNQTVRERAERAITRLR